MNKNSTLLPSLVYLFVMIAVIVVIGTEVVQSIGQVTEILK